MVIREWGPVRTLDFAKGMITGDEKNNSNVSYHMYAYVYACVVQIKIR